MRDLRSNTATRITVGPFLDKTDGITPELALTVTNEKLTLIVDTGGVPTLVLDTSPTASGGANDMVHVANDDAGLYDLELAAADVNYVGRAMLVITDAANHCPVFHEFRILSAAVYDTLYGTNALSTLTQTQVTGGARDMTDAATLLHLAAGEAIKPTAYGVSSASGTSTITIPSLGSWATNVIGSLICVTTGNGWRQTRIIVGATEESVVTIDREWITLPPAGSSYIIIPADLAKLSRFPDEPVGSEFGLPLVGSSMGLTNGAITSAKFAEDAIAAAAVKADAVTKIQAGLSTYAGGDTAGTTELLTRIPDATAGETGGLAIVGSAMTLTSAAIIAIWDAATSGLSTATTKAWGWLLSNITAIKAKTDTFSSATLTVTNPTVLDGEVIVYRKDDYAGTRVITLTVPATQTHSDWTAATMTLRAVTQAAYDLGDTGGAALGSVTHNITTAGGTVSIALTSADTTTLTGSTGELNYVFQVYATTAAPAKRETVAIFNARIVRDV